ncbi:Na+/H+ antiporter [Arthrobacter sp. Sa2CUA1]|uniref:Na+/H+ antiporter n=1 Tax=Arthrobacter gallicola TaxID=2762225 RepID=A0ABR8UPN2_9MICC|nr:Na+/H+ antiporter [Arthrobacter gallicola]MBD7994320.1 Na+/H+ antiporter [Arthrobacter gallicola]
MLGLELVVALGVAILVCFLAAPHLRIGAPLLLLGWGVMLGFVPAFREVELPSEIVLLIFLPALLYWECLTTSLREIRSNQLGIILMSTGLVVATAAGVAAAAHALGVPWGPAWVLGAAVAPTDATAVSALAKMLPHRSITLLRAESLVNDGTALVIYAVAVGIVAGDGDYTPQSVSGLLVLAYVGGAAAGFLVAWIGIWVRKRVTDPLLSNVITFLTPFSAFLLAEEFGGSGVLAVVVVGLIMSQAGPRITSALARRRAQAFWSFSTFMINAALFALIGIELHAVVRILNGGQIALGLLAVAVVSAVLIAVRFAYLFGSEYLLRLLARRQTAGVRQESNRARVVSGMAGFRGAVSLAAALGVPLLTAAGTPFPNRGLIIFVTAGVIVVTLTVQGPLLPLVAKWARLPHDTTMEEERRLAEVRATEDGLLAIPRLAAQLGTDPEVEHRLVREYRHHLRVLRADSGTGDEKPLLQRRAQDQALRLALLARKRAVIVRLRDERTIDDRVLRLLEARLDVEELALTRPDFSE